MELSYLLFTGSLSGLISILGHSVLWSLFETSRPKTATALDGQVQIAEAFLHMGAGIALGLLFWLSWGLAAVVSVPWWVRGLAFGGLASAIALSSLLQLRLSGRLETQRAVLAAARWLTTCVVAGLTCAWSWERSV